MRKRRGYEKSFSDREIKMLVDMGCYLLSDKRDEMVKSSENKKQVGDWDLANFHHYNKKGFGGGQEFDRWIEKAKKANLL